MSIDTKVEENDCEGLQLRVFNKYGLCELSQECFSYTPHDNMCNSNRALAYRKQGLPSCYKSLEKE